MIIRWPETETVTLTAEIEGDDGWTAHAYLWEQVSGPDSSVIATPDELITEVAFPSTQGTYIFRFTVTLDTVAAPVTTHLTTELMEELSTEEGEWLVTEESEEILADSLEALGYFQVTVFSVIGGYVPPEIIGRDLSITIDGTEYATDALDLTKTIDLDSLTISESKDSNPNTANFRVRGFYPEIGKEVIIKLDDERIFAGRFMRDAQAAEETFGYANDQVTVPDYTWYLTRRRVRKTYVETSGTTIAQYLISRAPGFSGEKIQGGLPSVTIHYDGEDLVSALNMLADQIPNCSWKVDYFRVLQFGTLDVSADPPEPITSAHKTVRDFVADRDLGQWVTRTRVNGISLTTNLPAKRGETKLYAHSVVGFEGGGQISIDGWDTIYEGIGRILKSETEQALLDDAEVAAKQDEADAAEGAEKACLEAQIRNSWVNVRSRAIRIDTADPSGGLSLSSYSYFTTFVTADGESTWKQWIGVHLPTFAADWGHNAAFPGVTYRYNAVEFIAENIPPHIQRINIYRFLLEGGGLTVESKGVLIGSLSGKGTFGELGHQLMVPWDPEVQARFNAGLVITPSTNSVTDTVNDRVLDVPEEIPIAVPTGDPCAADEAVDEEGNADEIPEENDYLYFLYGVVLNDHDIPDGATVVRFTIVDDVVAQGQLGAILDDDGIVEDEISDTSLVGLTAMINAGLTHMSGHNYMDRGVSYTCRDRLSHPGLYIAVSMTGPNACEGEFLIQSVTINEFGPIVDDNGDLKSYPLYTVKAAPRHLKVVNLLKDL